MHCTEAKGRAMDPNEALRMIRELVDATAADLDDEHAADVTDDVERSGRATELVDTFRGLDEWLSRGGFLPTEWQR